MEAGTGLRSVLLGVEIIKVAAKVLAAVTEKQSPDPADVEALRKYIQTTNGRDLDESVG